MTLKAFTFAGAEQPAERGLLSLARLSPSAFFRKSKAAGFVWVVQAALGAAPKTEGFWLAANPSFQVPLQKGNALPPLMSVLCVADKFPAIERQLLSGFLKLPPKRLFHLFFWPQ